MNEAFKSLSLCIVALSFLIFSGCASRPSPIPNGAYYSSSTQERVTVTPFHLALDLRVPHEGRRVRLTKVCDYTVLPDSRIWTWGYGSAEYASTYSHFDWSWTGSHIVCHAHFPTRTETVHFLPEL
jgi:hypothetical protein